MENPGKTLCFQLKTATTQVVPYLQVHPSKQDSLVKFHYFQLAFLENCLYKKQKKSKKDQRNFCSNTFLKVFANSVSAHFKIWCLRFSYKRNEIIFIISPVDNLPEIEECLYYKTSQCEDKICLLLRTKHNIVKELIFGHMRHLIDFIGWQNNAFLMIFLKYFFKQCLWMFSFVLLFVDHV